MRSTLKYRLEIMDMDEYERTKEPFHCTDIYTFFTLQDVWDFLGFKLQKICGRYVKNTGSTLYCVSRIN